MTDFTPIASAVGGALIGISSVLVLAFHGRIAGISGIVAGLRSGDPDERSWKAAFVGGLLGGGLLLSLLTPEVFGSGSPAPLPLLGLAGLLVGFGTYTGSGCTSGHGVCGISRLSGRSMLSTIVFMAVAGATVFMMRTFGGAS